MRFSPSLLKSLRMSAGSITCLLCLLAGQAHAADPTLPAVNSTNAADVFNRSLKMAIVNFRKCAENSKQGKQHQTSLEGMKSQMETLLQQKEKTLTELNTKLTDSDYMDGLTKEAENELKHKFRAQSQEYAQAQQQFMQTLQQAQMKVLEMLHSDVSKATNEVARAKGLDLVLNQEDALFYFNPALDISDLVVVEMNKAADIEQKKRDENAKATKTTTPAPALAPMAPRG